MVFSLKFFIILDLKKNPSNDYVHGLMMWQRKQIEIIYLVRDYRPIEL